MTIGILWPTFALVALVFVILVTLAVQRFRLIRRSPPTRENFATAESAGRYFQPVEAAQRNLANLFEMPVLYFALVPLLLLTRHADYLQVLLAWVFVLLRIVHSLVHVGGGEVRLRFMLFLASSIVLSAMWIGFAADMIAGATAMPALT